MTQVILERRLPKFFSLLKQIKNKITYNENKNKTILTSIVSTKLAKKKIIINYHNIKKLPTDQKTFSFQARYFIPIKPSKNEHFLN